MAKIAGGSFGSQAAVKKALEKGSGGGGLTWRVPIDGSIQVRFLTEPESWQYYYEWYDEASRTYRPLQEGENQKKVSYRVLANVVLRGDDGDERGGRVVPLKMTKDLAARVSNRYERSGTITNRDFTLSRTGKTMNDTKYDADAEPIDKQSLTKWELLDLEDVLEKELAAALAQSDEEETGVDTETEDDLEAEDEEVEEEETEDEEEETDEEAPVEYEDMQRMSVSDLKSWASDLKVTVPPSCKKSDLVDLVWAAMD